MTSDQSTQRPLDSANSTPQNELVDAFIVKVMDESRGFFVDTNSIYKDLKELKTTMNKVVQLLTEIKAQGSNRSDNDIIKLNIGGRIFATCKHTLIKSYSKPPYLGKSATYEINLFQEILAGKSSMRLDETGTVFIDRSPEFFNHVLHYLRSSDSYELPANNELVKRLYEEARFYKLDALKDQIFIKSISSRILNEKLTVTLFRTCDMTAQKWSLVYRATRDGFSASAFHAKCDGVWPTLVVVKTSMGYMFGGCTSKTWDKSHNGFKEDAHAFLFSLTNKQSRPVKIRVVDATKAILAKPNYGPSFGDGDLTLFGPPPTTLMPLTFYDNYDRQRRSYICKTNVSKSYALDEELLAVTQKDTFLAGSFMFNPVEVEVFAID